MGFCRRISIRHVRNIIAQIIVVLDAEYLGCSLDILAYAVDPVLSAPDLQRS